MKTNAILAWLVQLLVVVGTVVCAVLFLWLIGPDGTLDESLRGEGALMAIPFGGLMVGILITRVGFPIALLAMLVLGANHIRLSRRSPKIEASRYMTMPYILTLLETMVLGVGFVIYQL